MEKIVKFMWILGILVIPLLMLGCTPTEDEDDDDDSVTAGGNPSLVATRTLEAGEKCEFGGVEIESGIDENANGVLDPEEVDNVEKVCNGAPGKDAGEHPAPPTPEVKIAIEGDTVPGGTVILTATLEMPSSQSDGHGEESPAGEEPPEEPPAIVSYTWETVGTGLATITNETSASPTVTLASAAEYKEALVRHLVGEAEEGVHLAPDRTKVLGISPFALEETEITTFKVTITDENDETHTGTMAVMADLHTFAAVSPGLTNVPVGLPVLLHAKTTENGTYAWTVDSGTLTLNDETTQNPYFIPESKGTYVVTDTKNEKTLTIYAGEWKGAISGVDDNGTIEAENCAGCHGDTLDDWKETGHAHIFSTQLDASTHYGERCFGCHTVGFNPDVDNGGIDEASDYQDFLDAGLINKPGENWSTVVQDYEETAQLANIQCENCHGPNSSAAHANNNDNGTRVSLSSDVCATCHGEPARHGRFQQWQQSGHGSYSLAVRYFDRESCARCHAGQGYLKWLPQLQGGDFGEITEESITWTADEAHPVTCAVCHDSHKAGDSSGEPNTATVRVVDDTPMLPAGFAAKGVGRGALCMTCHNTRNGKHDDTNTDALDDLAPHTSAQTDVLMGENAYFVTTGKRAAHSYIRDTCTNCHMVQTDPPADLSYNLGGTNHTFEAKMDMCTNCHGDFDGGDIKVAMEAQLNDLQDKIEEALKAEIDAQITAVGSVVLLVSDNITMDDSAKVGDIVLTGYHGHMAMDITYDGTPYEDLQLASDTKVGTEGNILSSTNGQVIAKAAWNYFLIDADGSHGVHNPNYTNEVIRVAIEKLNEL